MNILVTGGAGYIGSVLCEYLLEARHNVTVLDNLMYGQSPLLHLAHHRDFSFITGDVRDQSLLKRLLPNFDAIIPLAAVVGAPACEKNPELAWSVNFEAIKNLNALRTAEQKVVFPTTNSGYGIKGASEICTEESPLTPISVYGRTKVEAEKVLLSAPNVISLRLATVFGASPRMRLDLLVNDFVFRAVKDGYLIIFEKAFRRNYIHIRDVARCVLHCLDDFSSMRGQVYNCGLDSANLSKEDLALAIKKHIPHLSILFSDVAADPDKRNYTVSSAKLYKTGFSCEYSLDDGIRELITAYALLPRHLSNA